MERLWRINTFNTFKTPGQQISGTLKSRSPGGLILLIRLIRLILLIKYSKVSKVFKTFKYFYVLKVLILQRLETFNTFNTFKYHGIQTFYPLESPDPGGLIPLILVIL